MSMADRDGLIWLDGEMVPWREAKVHVLTHTLHYGMGVFEGVRAYKTDKGPAARVARRFQEGVAPRNGEDVLEGLGLPVRGHAQKALRSQVGVTALNVAVTYAALVCKKGK